MVHSLLRWAHGPVERVDVDQAVGQESDGTVTGLPIGVLTHINQPLNRRWVRKHLVVAQAQLGMLDVDSAGDEIWILRLWCDAIQGNPWLLRPQLAGALLQAHRLQSLERLADILRVRLNLFFCLYLRIF